MDITDFVVSKRHESLLVGDYGSYRNALSRRILTLRRKLKRITPKGKKYTGKPALTAEEVSSNHEFVHLELLVAERAWAHAMHMKSTHSAESDKPITGSTRSHIHSRLEKAKRTAGALVEVLNDPKANVQENVLLEAQAYYYMLEGSSEFESRRWAKCLHAYSVVYLIYTVMAKSANSKIADVFRESLSGTVEPSIRYAAYQNALPRTMPIQRIVVQNIPNDLGPVKTALRIDPNALNDQPSEIEPKKGGVIKDLPKTITWRSRTVNLEDARIAQSLAAVFKAEEKLAKLLASSSSMKPEEKAAAYEEVLVPSQDAVDATKNAIDELNAEGVSSADHRLQALQVTRTALNYALIGSRVGRNRVLCGRDDGAYLDPIEHRTKSKSRKPVVGAGRYDESTGSKIARLRERVVLYESSIQSIESVRELPGVAADRALGQELDSKLKYFSALRCLALARSYTLLDQPKNALALSARALSTASAVTTTDSPPAQNKPSSLEVTSSNAHSLQQLLQILVTQQRALVELKNLQNQAIAAERGRNTTLASFIERLDEYPVSGVDLTHLVDYPPVIRPIPIKPILLDVAFNYLSYPGKVLKTSQVESNAGAPDEVKEEKKEAKKGWGWFGR